MRYGSKGVDCVVISGVACTVVVISKLLQGENVLVYIGKVSLARHRRRCNTNQPTQHNERRRLRGGDVGIG
jgi:hypothetical protein